MLSTANHGLGNPEGRALSPDREMHRSMLRSSLGWGMVFSSWLEMSGFSVLSGQDQDLEPRSENYEPNRLRMVFR